MMSRLVNSGLDGDPPRQAPNRDCRYGFKAWNVNDRDIIGQTIDGVKPAAVSVEGKLPDALADKHIFFDGIRFSVDRRDPIGAT